MIEKKLMGRIFGTNGEITNSIGAESFLRS
jgi:hypothetical protein